MDAAPGVAESFKTAGESSYRQGSGEYGRAGHPTFAATPEGVAACRCAEALVAALGSSLARLSQQGQLVGLCGKIVEQCAGAWPY